METQARTADPDRFELVVAPTTTSVSTARRAFTDWLDSVATDHEAAAELAVVFSELTANAVTAAGECGGEVNAVGWVDDDEVVVEIDNPVPPTDSSWPARWDLDDPLRAGGRGLLIVRAYVDDIDIAADDGRVSVRCRRRVRV